MEDVRFWKSLVSVLFVGLCLVFLFYTWVVLLPFLFGLVLAYLIDPLVDRFVSRGMRRDRIVFILYVLLVTTGVVLGSWLFPRLYREANTALTNLPSYAASLNTMVQTLNLELQAWLSHYIGDRAETVAIPFHAEKIFKSLFYGVTGNILNVAHVGMWIFIIPFVSYFALTQGPSWINRLFNWTPSEYVENLLGLLAEVNATLGAYVRGVLLESTCIGFLTMIGLLLLGVKGAILLGFVTALLNVVPFMALIVGGGITILAGYFQGLSLSVIFGIVILFLAVRVVDDILIIPFVMGQNVKLHPVLILFAILAGVEVGGFIGLIFAIPLAAVLKVVLTIILRDRHDKRFYVKQHVYS